MVAADLVPAQKAACWMALRKQAGLSVPPCYEHMSVGDAPNGGIPDRARHGWSIKSRGTFIFLRPRPRNPANPRGITAQAGTSVLCSQLLTKDPESRLSSLGDIQSAPYLADVNWDAVFEKMLTPGFVPNVSWGPVRWHATSAGAPTLVQRRTPEAVQSDLYWPQPLE